MSQALESNLAGHPHRERRPLAELLYLALPTVAQMASYTVMQFVDRIMLALQAAFTHSVVKRGIMVWQMKR